MTIKCPYCGGEEFIDVSVLEQPGFQESRWSRGLKDADSLFAFGAWISGDAEGEAALVSNMKAKICKKCGHVEFFAKELADEIVKKKIAAEKEEKRREEGTKKAEKEFVALLNRNKEIEKDIYDYIEKAKDENITVKQQKEYMTKIGELTRDLQRSDNAVCGYKNEFSGNVLYKYKNDIETIRSKYSEHDALWRKYGKLN